MKDSLRKFKESIGGPTKAKGVMEKEIKEIIDTDESFFSALYQFGLALKMTIYRDTKFKDDAAEQSAVMECITMNYTVVRALKDSGFIKIIPKEERIANNVLEDFLKNI